MAQNGLFTQGPSIDDLLAKRNQQGATLQQQLMQQAGQGSRDPMQAQAASLIGSSLGRALAGSLGGGQDAEREKLEATNAAQSQAQQGFLEAAQGGSEAMFEQVALLQKTHPAAAVKMLELAKTAKKEETATAAAAAKATADAEEATRVQDLAAQKIIDEKEALAYKYEVKEKQLADERAEVLRKEGATETAAIKQAEREAAKNRKTVQTAGEWNAANDGSLPEGTFWLTSVNGDMKQIAKGDSDPLASIQIEGMQLILDDKGNPSHYEPIENGPQWLAARKAEAELEGDEEREYNAQSVALQQGITINTAIDRALEIAELDSALTPIFGRNNLGKAAGAFEGTERSNLEVQMEPILADAAFDTLADMRAASKTGGALGAINKAELDLLKAARGALSLRQSKESWVRNMKDYQIRFKNGLHGSRADIERHNRKNPDSVPLVYWGDAEAAAKAEGKATQAEAGFGTGVGPNAAASAPLSATASSYFE